MRKFKDIIDRIEYLRNQLGLNKSRFSAEIGMKPQTYNNFIGSQGSKPNIELITGIVNRFGVNPMWLLSGAGSIFVAQEGPGGSLEYPRPFVDVSLGYGRVQEPSGKRAPGAATAEEIGEEIESIEPLLQKVEDHLKRVELYQLPTVHRVLGIFKRYYEIDPQAAVEEFRDTLHRIANRMRSSQPQDQV